MSVAIEYPAPGLSAILSMTRSADLLIGSIPFLHSNEPIRRSALRFVQGFQARIFRDNVSPSDGERDGVGGLSVIWSIQLHCTP